MDLLFFRRIINFKTINRFLKQRFDEKENFVLLAHPFFRASFPNLVVLVNHWWDVAGPQWEHFIQKGGQKYF